jgi:hypothetical protein
MRLFGVGRDLIRRRELTLQISEDHVVSAGMEGTQVPVITDEVPAYIGLRSDKGRWHVFMRRTYNYDGPRPWHPVPPAPA